MGEHHRVARRGAGALALAVLAAVPACRKAEPPAPAAAVQAGEPGATPVDQARPDELAEGTERAFGLPVPRRMRVDARFPDAVYATGDLPLERVANYVRQRVIAQHVETGPVKTVFAGATVKSAPQSTLRVEVVLRGGVTELLVRDETRPPAKPGLSPEERWKELGLNPDGTPIDPKRLE